MTWIDIFKEKPKDNGYYFTQRMEENSSDVWYSVDYFEPQDEYVEKYSKEFKQNVRVKVKSNESDFNHNGSFVIFWMHIPK